ncbi:aspartyl-phosphate phosphatase Spo0E family protein [Alicyclobacillus acidoterrestris]|uniref:Aspartyl-phosphate phosphatase Spo0E family protein n=1 Tax=Alicyclobacillus acidoterrestris (strain ATCC 49025 / DSM 3922 / CIP 106132 / NCIMB 13137 / GD3B) TaxID=1356854 RepID=A0A9E6ZR61_ALIAG|nr:aspartyl-phosphate phosphatase Spo0E family protein [Alicyclobacillus acidoterrestris]UNO47629.1 aspartyl-phosphate phosphatase Spo0E family protein [Alicyclobacillus acidoterrestris]
MLHAQETIETLRKQLVECVTICGSFTHPEVIQVSQRLDRLILHVQMEQLRLGDTTLYPCHPPV